MFLGCLLTLRAFIRLFTIIIQTQQMFPLQVAYSCSFYCLGYLGLKGLLLSWLWHWKYSLVPRDNRHLAMRIWLKLYWVGGEYAFFSLLTIVLACKLVPEYLQEHPQLQGFSCHPSEFLQSALGPKREAFMDGTMWCICNLRGKLSIVLLQFGV